MWIDTGVVVMEAVRIGSIVQSLNLSFLWN
jgi:hypothetical protein